LRDPGDVRSEDKAVPIDDRIERSRGPEAVGVFDGPASENASSAAAGDKEIVGVDVALGNDSVNAAVQVIEIVSGIGVVDQVGEFFAIAGAASRIRIKNDVAHGSPDLLFKVEAVAIVGKRAAVNLQNERIFFGGVKIGRVNDPTVNLALVFGSSVRP